MKEELCEKIVEARRKSGKMMAMLLVFEEVIRIPYECAPKVERSDCEKDQFYNEMVNEWHLQNSGEMILGLEDFNDYVGERIEGFEGVHGQYEIGKRRLLKFCNEKKSCVANTWFEKKKWRKQHPVWVELNQD